MRINRFIMIVICLAVSVLTFQGALFAQTGSVRVACADMEGKLLPGVSVTLLSLDQTVRETEQSKEDGTVIFDNVMDGAYRVVGRRMGYVPAYYEFVTVHSSQESVSLTLDRGMSEMLYFEDPASLQNSSRLVAEGVAASKDGRSADAESQLLRAVAADPSNPEAQYFLGVFYVQQKRYDKGMEALGEASKLAKMFADLPPIEGKADPSQYRKIYDNAQLLIKNAGLIKGQQAFQEKKYDEAVRAFQEAVAGDPDNAEAHAQLAQALVYTENLEEAMTEIEKAILLDPGKGNYSEVKKNISARIHNLAVGKAQDLINEGDELDRTGMTDEAIVKYSEAVAVLPEDVQSPIWKKIGKAQADLGKTDLAAEAYRKAAESASETDAPAYWSMLAQLYLDDKKYETAVDVLTDPKAMKPGESRETVLQDLVAKSKDREPKLAEAALERIIKANPENTEAYFTLGQMYYADGKEMDARAKELLTKYIEIGQNAENVGFAKDMLVLIQRRSK